MLCQPKFGNPGNQVKSLDSAWCCMGHETLCTVKEVRFNRLKKLDLVQSVILLVDMGVVFTLLNFSPFNLTFLTVWVFLTGNLRSSWMIWLFNSLILMFVWWSSGSFLWRGRVSTMLLMLRPHSSLIKVLKCAFSLAALSCKTESCILRGLYARFCHFGWRWKKSYFALNFLCVITLS